MATQQEIDRAQELLRIEAERLKIKSSLNVLDADAVSLSSALVDSIKEMQGSMSKRTTFDQSILKINRQITNEILGQKNGLSDVGSIQKQISKNTNLVNQAKKVTNALITSISEAELDTLNLARSQVQILSEQKLIQETLLKDAEKGIQISNEAYDNSVAAQISAEIALETEIEKLGALGKQAIFTEQNLTELERQNQLRNDEVRFIDNINKNLGITGSLLKGAEGFLGKIGLGALSTSLGFNEINKELNTFSTELETTEPLLSDAEKKQRVMAKGFALMGGSLKTLLMDPIAILSLSLKGISVIVGKIAEGFNRSQETTGNIAKNLSISNGEAMGITRGMTTASFGSDKLFISSKGLGETLVAINSSLGTSVVLSNEQLETFTKLRATAGLTNGELMGVQKLSLANGESFEDNANSLLNQVNALNKSSGLYVNNKDVLKEVNKLSSATTLSLGKNPKALAEAVTVAKSLGMEMSKIDAIAGSLLDFESSIENELQAELLLNKDINLEKARQAALNNDFATVAREISNQAGNSAEFTAMNRIQQESLAKAVGMSRDSLAETLFMQEAIAGASGDEAERREKVLNARIKEVGLVQAQKEAADGGLKAMLDQATASEKMQASMGKINELFTSIGSIFAPIVDMFANVAGFIMSSKEGMFAFAGILAGVVTFLSIMAVKAASVAVSSIFTGAMALGPLGIPLAIGGAAALVGGIVAASSIGDINSPADGKTQISTKEGGLFELSKNDDIVAFPGASKMASNMPSAGTTTVVQAPENKETNSLLAQLVMQNKKQPQLSSVGLYEVQ
jgi:hypothetical protein